MMKETFDGLALVATILGVLAVIAGVFFLAGGIAVHLMNEEANQRIIASWHNEGNTGSPPPFMMIVDSSARFMIVQGGIELMVGIDLFLLPWFFRRKGHHDCHMDSSQ